MPATLQELPRQVQFDRAVAVINRRHVRVAKSIKIFWGHHDCAVYLQSLILCGVTASAMREWDSHPM
jgi:hypothetical protein